MLSSHGNYLYVSLLAKFNSLNTQYRIESTAADPTSHMSVRLATFKVYSGDELIGVAKDIEDIFYVIDTYEVYINDRANLENYFKLYLMNPTDEGLNKAQNKLNEYHKLYSDK